MRNDGSVSWCHEGHVLHVLFQPSDGDPADVATFFPRPLCGAAGWKISDGDGPAIDRDHLICGKCWAMWLPENLEDVVFAPRSTYDEYLRSDHWQHMRDLTAEYYGNSCCLCGSSKSLNVHRTDARKGRELLRDLILLCDRCHENFHRIAS